MFYTTVVAGVSWRCQNA